MPVSHIHSIARADVVFVAPVPPAVDRVTPATTVGTMEVRVVMSADSA